MSKKETKNMWVSSGKVGKSEGFVHDDALETCIHIRLHQNFGVSCKILALISHIKTRPLRWNTLTNDFDESVLKEYFGEGVDIQRNLEPYGLVEYKCGKVFFTPHEGEENIEKLFTNVSILCNVWSKDINVHLTKHESNLRRLYIQSRNLCGNPKSVAKYILLPPTFPVDFNKLRRNY